MTHLFNPLRLRSLELANRAWVSPMCMYSAVDGVVGDFHVAHLGSFSLGRAGLVMAEATGVVPAGRISVACPGIWNDSQVAATCAGHPGRSSARPCGTEGVDLCLMGGRHRDGGRRGLGDGFCFGNSVRRHAHTAAFDRQRNRRSHRSMGSGCGARSVCRIRCGRSALGARLSSASVPLSVEQYAY